MKWTEVKVETASEAVEAISNIMMEAGASGVAIEDALDIENFESDLYGEILDKEQFTHIKEGAIVMAYFPETTFLPEILPFMKENILRLPEYGLSIGKNEMTISEVAESDWATAWKKYYHPVRVTRFLTIVPSWEAYHAQDEAEKIITLDPHGFRYRHASNDSFNLASFRNCFTWWRNSSRCRNRFWCFEYCKSLFRG